MANKIIGKLDNWDDADLGGGSFMKLKEGTNTCRIIGSPYQLYNHWTKDASGAKVTQRCAINGCPLCLKGEKASARWMIAVINRATEKCAVLEIGVQVFRSLLSLKNNPKWGDPRKYDIDILRQPEGTSPLYVVQASPPVPMTDEEKKMAKQFLEETNLQEMTEAPTPEEVNEKLGFSSKKPSDKKTNAAVNNDFSDDQEEEETRPPAKSTTSKAAKAAPVEESDDFDFGDT